MRLFPKQYYFQRVRRVVRTAVALLATATAALCGTVSPQLSALAPNQSVQVIVQHTPSLLGGLVSTVCGALDLLQLLPGGELCSMTAADAINLAQNPLVAHVSVNNILQATGTAVPLYDYTPQTLQPASATAGSANPKLGQNVGVAIIDSGIQINQDLIGNGSLLDFLFPQVVYAQSFVPGEGVDDYYGHGTHIAGIIAGNGANSSGPAYLHDIHGIAPGAHLISLKVLDVNGESTDAEVIQAIDQAIQLKDLYGIKVINLSLGRPVYESYTTDPLCQEVEKAWLNGITVVVAAGNGGRYNPTTTHGY
jgi:serine protease AprX